MQTRLTKISLLVLPFAGFLWSACTAHGSKLPPGPLGRHWANPGLPFSRNGTTYDPRHPAPGPTNQFAMSAELRSHMAYGGMSITASSCSSATSASMS